MPFVQTKEVGIYNVFIGVKVPSIDPVESAKAIQPHLEETNEHLRILELKKAIEANLQLQATIWAAWKKFPQGTSQYADCKLKWGATVAEYANLQLKAREAQENLDRRYKLLLEEYGVRFTIPGLEEVDEAACAALLKTRAVLKEHQCLLSDGTVVENNIGQRYWLKDGLGVWAEHEITELGGVIPSGSAPWDELSDADRAAVEEQFELARLAILSPEQKTAEKEDLIAKALVAAGAKRSQFEIQGTLEPLAEAQAWYAERCAWIEARYS